jgi:hypothetical protein
VASVLDRRLGNLKAKHQEFTMDPGGWPQSFQAEKPVRSRMELCAKLELSAWRVSFHQPPQTPARLAVLKQQFENKSPGFLVAQIG